MHLAAIPALLLSIRMVERTGASRIDETHLNQDLPQLESVCGGFVTSLTPGQPFTTPFYPRAYPNATRCTRLFKAPSVRQRIVLRFLAFDMEKSKNCAYDYLVLKDGPYGFSPEIAKMCGSRQPLTLKSTGQYLLATFASDDLISKQGFLAEFSYEVITPEEGVWLGDPCFVSMTLEGVQGSSVIEWSGISQHYSNHTGRLPAIDCVWDIRSSDAQGMIFMWVYKAQQPAVGHCPRDRIIQVYAPKATAKLYDIDTPVHSTCYQGDDRIYPGSSRLLVHVYARSPELLPHIEFNYTIYTAASAGGMCPAAFFDCEDGRVCLNTTMKCNGLENCPSGYDENRKYCVIKQIHENKWLQLIFLMAAICGLFFVTAALACSAASAIKERLRQRQQDSSTALVERRSSAGDVGAEEHGHRCADANVDGDPEGIVKRREAFYGSWMKPSLDSTHAA